MYVSNYWDIFDPLPPVCILGAFRWPAWYLGTQNFTPSPWMHLSAFPRLPPTVYVLKEHPLRGRVKRRRWQVKMEVALHIRELGKKLLYSGSDFSGPLIERRFRHPPDCKAKKMGNRPITPYVVDDRFNSNYHYFFSKSLLSITVAGHKSWQICSKWTLWTIILTLFTIGRTK